MIAIEIAPFQPELDGLVGMRVPPGTTVIEALRLLGIEAHNGITVGVWGRRADTGVSLENGDRIEFYHELRCDPKAARRSRARQAR